MAQAAAVADGGVAAADACGAAAAAPLAAQALPPGGAPTPAWCLQLQAALAAASWAGVAATAQVLPAKELTRLLRKAAALLDKEPTLLELAPPPEQRWTIVGDTHGQFHDLARLFELFGHPSAERVYVFNGDYVDRGAWGVETLALLLAWKVALPAHVYLLRGNHEGRFCTTHYGLKAEVAAKYGKAGGGVYKELLALFACLPLAALVGGRTLVLHGGLFRAPPRPAKGQPRPRGLLDLDESALALGGLQDLRAASKGGADPDPERSLSQLVASDVLWSDPSPRGPHRPNALRGVGTVFGPDVTEAFLAASNGVRLIIRSHEGPDARRKRSAAERMPDIDSGWSIDHDGPHGQLATLFSAPDYPQFMAGEERHNNRGAVAHLSAPGWATPEVEHFDAAPRPQAQPYYDMQGPASGEESEDEAEPAAPPPQHSGGSPPPSSARGAAGSSCSDDGSPKRGAGTQPEAAHPRKRGRQAQD
ncbi:PP7 [Scenedesmus sp. PABB004]|nr:PP7 [Scenedesmus sp. PABB004]